MSMWRKIKSLFVVEDTQTVKDVPKKAGKKEPVREDVSKISIDHEGGKVTQNSLDKFLKVLAEAMEEANIEGYDYLEFKQAVRSLEKIETDEAKRYVTSYTLARTMGAQKESLGESAAYYLDVLKKEEQKFNDSLQKQIESKLNVRKKSVDTLKKQKSNKLTQIKKLQEEIKGIDQKLSRIQNEIDKSTEKVASVQKSFHAAYELIVNQIEADLNKMEKYLK